MFNVRIYGLLVHAGNLLAVEEPFQGKTIVKLPGGGLEFGEGTIGALRREFKEELDLEVQIVRHAYTTDFFIRSFLKPEEQVIAIYYFVACDEWSSSENLPVLRSQEDGQRFFWVPLTEKVGAHFDLDIDKAALRHILQENMPSVSGH
jgi:8-oxo-dGTP diphosphatase